MRGFATFLAGLGCLHFAGPAQACVKVTPAVRAWAQCSYKVASETGDHIFMVNFARAKDLGHELLPTAEPRWERLEPRIVSKCGSYTRAAAKDRKSLAALRKSGEAFYVPKDQFEAIFGTGDISELVKSNA